jgi:phosphopantetheinyl transferase (holo-ACP synthase)
MNRIISSAIELIKVSDLSEVETYLLSDELAGKNIQSIAGVLAAKKAIIKTGFATNPTKFKIQSDSDGRPRVFIQQGHDWLASQNIDVSISHSGDYAVAISIMYISKT